MARYHYTALCVKGHGWSANIENPSRQGKIKQSGDRLSKRRSKRQKSAEIHHTTSEVSTSDVLWDRRS